MNYQFGTSIKFWIVLGLLLVGVSACDSFVEKKIQSKNKVSGSQVKAEGFRRLAQIREKKKKDVIKYFSVIKEKMTKVDQDKELLQIFHESKQQKSYEAHRFEEKYVFDYGEFYDLLMIDETGFIFDSLRKESDYKKNIFASNLLLEEGTELSKQEITFVDYKVYAPSNESAAFFIVPINPKGTFEGWLAFQLPINKFNWILTDRKELGRTGEVYLVNQNMVLMTESRFLNDSSALKLQVETDAVKNALQFDKGEGVIKDYRDVRVFSSFEKFEQLGATWIIIAEIDEAEILTEAFLHSDVNLLKSMAIQAAIAPSGVHLPKPSSADQVVDIGEFKRSTGNGQLLTYGVATCTAIGIQLPERFAYLTHISPTDAIYLAESTVEQNLLAQLLERITYFELLPVEKKEVNFVLVAPHTGSLEGAVSTILSQGFDLKNIRFCFNPNARGANVAFQPFKRFQVEWYGNERSKKQDAFELLSLQELYAQAIGY